VPLPSQPDESVGYDHLIRLEREGGIDSSFLPERAERKYTVRELLEGVRDDPARQRGDLGKVDAASSRDVSSAATLPQTKRRSRSAMKSARHVVAVEMESAGIYKAVHGRVPFLAIRGISDVIGLKRDPEWTTYACETAAAFAHALLLTRPFAPVARK
jgi:hypothetical protein